MTTCFTATPGVDLITTSADIPALGCAAPGADRVVGPDLAALEAMLAGMADGT